MGHFKVSVNDPELMEGVPVEVPGVGYIDNGSTVEVELLHEPFWFTGTDGTTMYRNVPSVVTIEEVKKKEGGESG